MYESMIMSDLNPQKKISMYDECVRKKIWERERERSRKLYLNWYSTVHVETIFISAVPFCAQAKIEHAIVRVVSDFFLDCQELRQDVL